MKHSSLVQGRQRRWGAHISMDPIPAAEFRPLSATNNKSKVCSGLSWCLSSQANILSQVIWLFSFPKPFQMVKKKKSTLSSYSHTSLSAYFCLSCFFGSLAWLDFLPCNFVSSICSLHSRISLDSAAGLLSFSISFCSCFTTAFASLPCWSAQLLLMDRSFHCFLALISTSERRN